MKDEQTRESEETNPSQDESEETNPSQDELLAQRLTRQGLAERPPFSPQLHRRILDRLDGAERSPAPAPAPAPARGIVQAQWRAIAAAIMLVVGAGAILMWMTRPSPPNEQSSPSMPGDVASTTPPLAQLATRPLQLGHGIASARLWPPTLVVPLPPGRELALDLPTQPAPGASSTAVILPSSPDWMFARLDDAGRHAQAALHETLHDVVPSSLRHLFAGNSSESAKQF